MKTDTTYTNVAFDSGNLANQYDGCTFESCTFVHMFLGERVFCDCTFRACDFTNTTFDGTGIRDCHFVDSKLLSAIFDSVNPFLLRYTFSGCNMSYSSFVGVAMSGTIYHDCQLSEADFTNADVSSADFTSSDLDRATFHNTHLSSADLSQAMHVSLSLQRNIVRGLKLKQAQLPSLLTEYKLHILNFPH